MLLPIDPGTLQRNPNLELLYKDLCTRRLNPDGSTRDTKKQRMHDEIRRNLITARSTLLNTQILISALTTLPSRAPTLPEELHACIDLVSAILSGQHHHPPLHHRLPPAPPSAASLPTTAEDLVNTATLSLPNDLATAMIQLTNTLTSLLALHKQLLETAIRILEQTQHGALARHTKAAAEQLHARATLLGLQAKSYTFAHPPPVEFVGALKEFRRGQGAGERALRDREALARQSLKLYGMAGEKGIRELARRKGVLETEMGRMEGEIVGLESGR
ncbi:hypothetical protein EJ07DRAFT_165677 [Lizonia empirigonia]|nr:hypothetical protein EJ07DRAFT_165677 [Lizonia empirigonia]